MLPIGRLFHILTTRFVKQCFWDRISHAILVIFCHFLGLNMNILMVWTFTKLDNSVNDKISLGNVRKLIPQHDVFANCNRLHNYVPVDRSIQLDVDNFCTSNKFRWDEGDYSTLQKFLGISSILRILQQAPCGNDRFKFIMVDGMNNWISIFLNVNVDQIVLF